jgi:hypothetical protein
MMMKNKTYALRKTGPNDYLLKLLKPDCYVKKETSSGKPKKDLHQVANKVTNRRIYKIPEQTFLCCV